jgi:hypothetical protein
MPFLRISSQESQIGIGIMIHDAITFCLSTRRPLEEMRVSAVSFGSTLGFYPDRWVDGKWSLSILVPPS